MSTIVKDITTFKKHVTVSFNFDFEILYPYVIKQERKHIKPLLGPTLYSSLQSATTGVQKEVLDLLQEASSNLAMLTYTKVGVVTISKSGFLISQGEHAVPANWAQLRDLRRELMQSGMEAIDEALAIMEENEEGFPDWIDSQGYTDFKELFTRKTQTFQKYFNIENSRLTFLRLKSHLLKVENKYFRGLLGMETVSQIKAGSTAEEKEALRLCQAAQVPLSVSEIANEGAFLLTPKGIFYEIDEIPGEKRMKVEELELRKLYASKQEEGNEQLKILLSHLRAYPQTFINFTAKETTATPQRTHNTKSTVGF